MKFFPSLLISISSRSLQYLPLSSSPASFFTLPAVVADAELLPGQVAVAAAWTATVVPAVRDVTGFSFPVLLTLAVDPAGRRVGRAASAVAGAVVGAGVHPETVRQRVREALQGHSYCAGLREVNTNTN